MSENNLYIREGLLEKFEFQSYGHALEILNGAFQTSLDKGTQRKTTENELPSLTQCTA